MYELKKQLIWSKLKVGAVVTSALLVLFITVFFAGSIENILSPKETITVDMMNVEGLRKGSPVWFSGVEIGSVKSIDLHPEYGTVVAISIKRDVLPYIRKDSRASVHTMGLLGDKYIELSSGSTEVPAISPGEMLTGTVEVGVQDLIETSAIFIVKMNEVIEQLGRLVSKIEEGEGSVAKFISDPSVYDNLKKTTQSLSDVLADIEDRKGTMGMLIQDQELYNTLVSAAASIDEFGTKLNEEKGTLKMLVEDRALYDRLLAATVSIEEFSSKLSKEPGTLNKFIEDPQLYDNLSESSAKLSSILERIDRGEGTAGALLRDEEMARELKETLRELKELTADIKENPEKYFKFTFF